MRWQKQGLVYGSRGDLWWARSYALLPTAEVIDDSTSRVYSAALYMNRYGRIGYVEVDADRPQCVLYEAKERVLEIGELGTFDDSGVNPWCVVNFEGTTIWETKIIQK